MGGDRRPGVRLRGLPDPADLRLARADGCLPDRGRQGPLPLAVADLPDSDPAGNAGRAVRRLAAGVPARPRGLRQRPATGRVEHLHDRQPGPAAVRRGSELAARLGDDGRDDDGAHRADGLLPARDVVEVSGAVMARARSLERKPAFAVAVTVLFFAWLYLPIFAVALFSFNDKKSLSSFSGFSTRWYDDFFHNEALLESLVASLGIALVAALGSLLLGTMLALGLERVRSRRGRVIGAITLLPLVTPEIVTGVAALLVFTAAGLKLSLGTVAVSYTHLTLPTI